MGSQLAALWNNRTARAGVVIVGLFLLSITLGGALMPYSATDMDLVKLLAPPDIHHPFGTDSFGRDVLTRVLLGGRVSLLISVSGVALAAVIGIPAGLLSAWYGGWTDQVLMRFADLLFAFPSFVLALFLMVVLTMLLYFQGVRQQAPWADAVRFLAVYVQVRELGQGQLDLRTLALHLSVCVLALFVTVKIMENRRRV